MKNKLDKFLHIEGKHVLLQKLSTSDSEFCVSLRNSNQAKFLNAGSKNVNDQNQWLSSRPENEMNYIIKDKLFKRIGMISLISIDLKNLIAEPARFIMLPNTSHNNNQAIFESLYLIYGLAFDHLSLNKLYGVIAKSNRRMIDLQGFLGMEIEGLLKRHSLINGEFEDLCAIALFRVKYYSHTRKILEMMIK